MKKASFFALLVSLSFSSACGDDSGGSSEKDAASTADTSLVTDGNASDGSTSDAEVAPDAAVTADGGSSSAAEACLSLCQFANMCGEPVDCTDSQELDDCEQALPTLCSSEEIGSLQQCLEGDVTCEAAQVCITAIPCFQNNN